MVVEVTNIGDNYTCKPNLTIKQIENDRPPPVFLGFPGSSGSKKNSKLEGTSEENIE